MKDGLKDVEGALVAARFELLACLQCGRCTGGCPMSIRSPLNSRSLVYEAILGEDEERILSREEVWDCTGCQTCTSRCPRGLDPAGVIRAIRGRKIEGGRIPKTLMDALESLGKHGNPWGRSRIKRFAWAEGQSVRSLENDDGSGRLFYVGCTPSYDPRCQEVARSLALIFNATGYDYTTLGNEEACCGSEFLRLGETGLFEELKETNRENFRELGITEIVTASPHCLNTFIKDYELEIPALHYTQVLARLAVEGGISWKREIPLTVAFHDPCYLGKQNGIFEPPREALGAIPGVRLVEFDRSRERSLCCEGGGGRMWLEGEGRGERNAQLRVRDAAQMGVDAIAVACPFCLLTLEDAVKTSGLEGKLKIMDVSELFASALIDNTEEK